MLLNITLQGKRQTGGINMNPMGSQEDLGSNPMMDELSDLRFMSSLNLRFPFTKMQIIETITTTIIISNSKVL